MADRVGRGRKTSKKSRTILIVLLVILAVLIALAAFVLTRTKPDPYTGQGENPSAGVDFNNDGLEEGETIDPEAPTVNEDLAGENLETLEDHSVSKDEGWTHYLLMGIDGTSYSGHSDAMIVMSVNKDEQRVTLASIPRDTFVYIEGKGFGKLNGAYYTGGADLAVQTFEENFDIDIANYFVVNFDSLPEIVDLVGGVTLTLTDAEAEHMGRQYAAWGLSGGTQVLNGDEVLAYCRVRKIDSDYRRNDRQFNALMAIYDKVKDMSYDKYIELAGIAYENMYSDMTLGNMLFFAKDVMDILSVSELEHIKLVDTENSYTGTVNPYGSIVMVNDLTEVAASFRENLGIEGYTPSARVQQIAERMDEVLGR